MKVLVMIYILIGFVIDVVLAIGLIYLDEDFKKKHLNPILALCFIEMLFIWPYVMFIYKPKSDMEVSDE